MNRKYKLFFSNKTCDICKSPADKIRVFKNKKYMLCSGKKCDKITRIKHGFFGGVNL